MWTATGVWRWRRNPLRRPTDLVEAWVAFAAVVCVLLVAPAVGCAAGLRVDDRLQRAAREQQQERFLVPAVVVRPAEEGRGGAEANRQRQSPRRTLVVAEWTAPDGSSHRGTVPAAEEPPQAGDRFRIWTDTRGRLVGRPLDPASAGAHAAVVGLAAAAGVALLAETGRRLVVRRLVHRRHALLDRAWAEAWRDWGRAGAGS
ncbi:Rv1733c family protein [Streptomyces toxytricini]|uniref:Integral membrane protein n=1 Tax=Streptomyces toxytricini TaxID=67369 RepID=A0ABW8EDE6_STRT5